MRENPEYPKEEAERRAQAVARRMLNTPPKPQSSLKAHIRKPQRKAKKIKTAG